MFTLPDSAPWWAWLVVVVLFVFLMLVRALWPQESADRKELWLARQRERARRRNSNRRE